MLIAARQMVQGAQISAPSGRYSSAVDVLEALGNECASRFPNTPLIRFEGRSRSGTTFSIFLILPIEKTGHFFDIVALQ